MKKSKSKVKAITSRKVVRPESKVNSRKYLEEQRQSIDVLTKEEDHKEASDAPPDAEAEASSMTAQEHVACASLLAVKAEAKYHESVRLLPKDFNTACSLWTECKVLAKLAQAHAEVAQAMYGADR